VARDARRPARDRLDELLLAEDGLLVGYLETEDFEAALAGMEATDVNARWQAAMSEFLVPPLRRIEEVFHLD
jgi:L-rhamnose mutarotase